VAHKVECDSTRRGVPIQFLVGDFGRTPQRIVGALVERTNALVVETLLIHFQIGPKQQRCGKVFDGEADRFGGRVETPVADRSLAPAATARIELRRRAEIERDRTDD